jgi:hypothetical protein
MALSASTNFAATRDDIINRALRIVGAIGQNETPDTSAVTEAALALNMIVKQRAADGMQLWKVTTSSPITLTAGVSAYNIGIGATVAQQAPLKIIQAWFRTTANNADSPINIITKAEYDRYGIKSSPGSPSQLFYKTPGPNVTEIIGTINLYPTPDANAASTGFLYVTGIQALQDFDTSTDNPDFPSYYFLALVWLLASDLSTEYGVPLSERGLIEKRAQQHLQMALDFDMEEGSFYVQADPGYGEN